jgi:hypothetical protein
MWVLSSPNVENPFKKEPDICPEVKNSDVGFAISQGSTNRDVILPIDEYFVVNAPVGKAGYPNRYAARKSVS